MESSFGETDKNREELGGRKKSRFKQLKTRLFGKLRKKESEGFFKQSQSASDITAAQRRRDSYDSEEEFTYPQCLSSRALSHDSIFFSDQTPPSEPTRVLSQESVHGKIKALQLKIQQQNLHLGPPPMLIPGKRREDSGTTSEDDGLPCSPPESCFSDQEMHRAVHQFHDPQKHLSSLSLGTGSEEEVDADQLLRTLSLGSKLSSQPISSFAPAFTTPPSGVDFSNPVFLIGTLDNSAARHRMLVKPRNQRASTRGKRNPTVPLLSSHRSESIGDLNNVLSEVEAEESSMEIMTLAPQVPDSTENVKIHNHNEKTGTQIMSLEPELNPLFVPAVSLISGPPSPSGTSRPPELNLRETETLRASSVSPKDNKVENLVVKEGIVEEASFRLHPVPLPRTKTPKVDPKEPFELASVQFLIASAKNRSKTNSEERELKITTPSINTELQKERNPPRTQSVLQETKSFRKDPAPVVMSKPMAADLNTANIVTGNLNEAEEQRNAFGVRLRTTSLSLKNRSTVSKLQDDIKRHSLESNTVLEGSQEHDGKTETSRRNPKKQSRGLEDKTAAADGLGSAHIAGVIKEAVSEPGWMSLAREKTRAYKPSISTLSAKQSQLQTSAPARAPKPALLPKAVLKPQNPVKGRLESSQRASAKHEDKRRSSVSEDDGTKRAAGSSKMVSSTRPAVPNVVEGPTSTEFPGAFPSSPVFSQPSWMELAKRKSLAWIDKSLE